jgi:hypothetical protein
MFRPIMAPLRLGRAQRGFGMKTASILAFVAALALPAAAGAQEACRQLHGQPVTMAGVVDSQYYDDAKDSFTLLVTTTTPCGMVYVTGKGNPRCKLRGNAEVKGTFKYSQPMYVKSDIEAMKVVTATSVACP